VHTHTLTCPLCALRFSTRPELELHAREDHAPPAEQEAQETLVVPPQRWSKPRAGRLLP